MSDLFRERMKKYLENYVTLNESCFSEDGKILPRAIKKSLVLLIEHKVKTKTQITKELIKEDVILPEFRILEWMNEIRYPQTT